MAQPPAPPPVYNDNDDGLECGQRGGHRARGKCFAIWEAANIAECEQRLGGVFYAADAKGPAFCAYNAAANPVQNTGQSGDCGFAGGTMQGNECRLMGVTRQDCADLSGRIVESGGYQYCFYNPAALAQVAAAKKRSTLRDRIRRLLFAKFDN